MGGIRMPNLKIEYVEKRCVECKQMYEVRTDKQDTMYGMYCPICFVSNVVEDVYGALRPKTEEEKEKDLSYKDELQEITHRGKTRVPK
jgi:carboxypeptidase C (cathepsin A)